MTPAPTLERTQPGSPPRRRHPVARVFGAITGWACAVLAAVGLTVHFLDTRHQTLIVLASAAWVLAPFSVVALGLHLWRRAWFASAVAVLLVVGQSIVYAPLFVAQSAPTSPAATVRVMTQNLLYGGAGARSLVTRIKATHADVFVAQELTPGAVDRLRAAGLDEDLPYSLVDARPEAAGTGIWSRYPITDRRYLAPEGLAGVVGRVVLPGNVALGVGTLHPSAPFPQDPAEWYRDLDRIRALLLSLPSGPMVVGGDFNSTYDNARFRRLLVDGWRDGAEQAGSGIVRSWPSDQTVPPVVGIDHVLTRGVVATSTRTSHEIGSDHLGLSATVVVPR